MSIASRLVLKPYPFHATVPATVEYKLTSLGRSLGEAVTVIRGWAYNHMPEIESARKRNDGTREQ